MSMNDQRFVGEVHDVRLTIYRNQNTLPDEVLWQENQCFRLNFESPYRNSDFWRPFADGTNPTCSLITQQVTGIDCWIGNDKKDLLFKFTGIQSPTLTQIIIEFSNFHNPWSEVMIRNIIIFSYESPDCSGQSYSSFAIGPQVYYPKTTPAANVKITSNKMYLGDSSHDSRVNFSWTPIFTTSKDGQGSINIEIPKWYNVQNRLNMMFDESAFNTCTSPDMDITESKPDIVSKTLTINYKNMKQDKISGAQISITCEGFKNPIYQGMWNGFRISVFDSEDIRRRIEVSEDVSFDATRLQAAPIAPFLVTIAPTIFTIGSYSIWVLSVTLFPIPLETGCFVEITVPVDLRFNNIEFAGYDFMQPNSGVVVNQVTSFQNSAGDTVVRFQGCFSENTIGPSPQARLEINQISTPLAVKETGRFFFSLYKDAAFTSKIAELTEGIFIPAGDLSSGNVDIISIIPQNPSVQILTTYTIIFLTEHTLYANELGGSSMNIQFPETILLPQPGSIMVVTPVGDTADFFVATFGMVEINNVIYIQNIFGDQDPKEGILKFEITIEGIVNPQSERQAGTVIITTLLGDFVVDQGTSDSFIPQPGVIKGKPIDILFPVTSGTDSSYTLIYELTSRVPADGFIVIIVPNRLVLRPTEVRSNGICTQPEFVCDSNIENNTIKIMTKQPLSPGQFATIVLFGITNPRNLEPTGPFHFITYDTDGVSRIDYGFDIDTRMQDLAEMDGFTVVPSSDENGYPSTYTFTITTTVTIIDGDVIRFTFPPEIGLPGSSTDLNVQPIPRDVGGVVVYDVLKVEQSGQSVFVTFIQVAQTTGTYGWTLMNINNPPSTKPSSTFTQIVIVDNNGSPVQELNIILIAPPYIVNVTPATIIFASLIQKNNEPATVTTYEIRFTPRNPIPADGAIQIKWPVQIIIDQTVKCTVITNRAWEQSCTFNYINRTINIANVFSEQQAFISEVTVILIGVTNPQNNKDKGSGFKITTYADSLLVYWIDLLPDDRLYPTLDCDYPCNTCLASNRKYCQSCWLQSFSDRKYLYCDDNSCDCLPDCPYGWTRDGSDSFVCIPCDVSCASCKDEDKYACIDCPPQFPYRVAGTPFCYASCKRGLYETTTSNTCATCNFPCGDCAGHASRCIWCDPDSENPVLYQEMCWPKCPEGYTNVGGVCQKCASPCLTCDQTATNCITCDGTLDRKYLFSGICYAICPVNSAPIVSIDDLLECRACLDSACELCDSADLGLCKRCSTGLYLHDGKCQSFCPGGWKINDGNTACYIFTINDVGIIPFPFLIAAFIGCVIACFGKCKKKKIRATYISTQNTITCCIVIIAFIQFLAVIALIIWAFLFGTMFLFWAAIALLACLILLNIVFQIFFSCIFNRRITPKDKYRKYKEGKITKAELKRFIVPSDELFYRYVANHRCFACFIAIFTFSCTFKCNKAYYSHFYSFGMFKARWSQGRYYRKSMTIFCIVSMVIDAMLICLCIASLLGMVIYSHMLWVTAVEVAVLSALLIILGCIELFKMKEYLKYNERYTSTNVRQKFEVTSAHDFMDKDSRQVMMKNLLMNVRTNHDMFLNNKLDDLLMAFGNRKCKSMFELGTGWDKEHDPRMVITWPLSPMTHKEYAGGEYHFTRADMIGGFEDNVYAECRIPDPVYEVAVQGDQPQQDFMRQLGRKQGDLLASAINAEDEFETRGSKLGNSRHKRRGRKNKYHVAIEAEDDEEVDNNNQTAGEESNRSDNEDTTRVILREQEEEENLLKIQVEEERLKQERMAAERRQKLQEAEKARLEADAAEEEARRLRADEEERLRLIQEEEELERMRQNEITRIMMLKEEQDAKRKAEEEEQERQRQLAAMNEANRAKYEAEEAARRKAIQEEQERLRREKEAQELKKQADLAELNQRKLEESQRLQAQRDEEEFRLRKQMLEEDEIKRQEAKEAERMRLEQENAERLQQVQKATEEKRAKKLEEDRLRQEEEETDRQRKLNFDAEERERFVLIEEEKRQKLIMEQTSVRLRIEEETRVHRERLEIEEVERKRKIEIEEKERFERIRREEDRSKLRMEKEEAERRARLEQTEYERLELLKKEETERLERLRVEEEQRLEALRVEEETRRYVLKQEEETRRYVLKQEEETRLRRIEEEEEERRLKEEDERQQKRLEEEKKAREEEDRILKEKQLIEEEKARLAELRAQQQAELTAIAQREEERKQREARETEERLERERVDKENLEKEKAELERKKKEAEERLNQELDEAERARVLKEAEDLERQAKLAKDREEFEAEKRRKAEEEALKSAEREAARQAALKEAEEKKRDLGTQMSNKDKLIQEVNDFISEKKIEEEDEPLESAVKVNKDAIKDFQKQEHPVEIPPDAEKRNFNVHDILGELDRDNRGNIIVLDDGQGNHIDKTGQLTNVRGYLTNPLTGEILENHTKQKLFDAADIDEKGEVPAPFCLEKFNFNPHELMGDVDFQYDGQSGRAIPQLLQTKQGFYVDKKGRRVNRFGWLVQGGNAHIVDRQGRKKFDRKQLDDNDIQKLLNYNGKRYDIKDVIGVFEKDANGQIILSKQGSGPNDIVDNVGRRVNPKGYLVDENGNIIDREGRKIWDADHLKNNEPPKIFLFTKFDIDKITGDFELSPLSEPILDQDKDGNLVDRQGRRVNPRGYLIDNDGNIIDKRGNRMFDKNILTQPGGEIPKIFRMQILKTDSGSSLSRLMDEIEKNQPSEIGDERGPSPDGRRSNEPRRNMLQDEFEEEDDKDGDTSMDSAMEDTPANYNIPNQRFDDYEDYEAIPEESERMYQKRNNRMRQEDPPEVHASTELPRKKTKKRNKKKKKAGGNLEYLMPTNKEINMADAYGGQAKGQFRRPGVKYDKERLMNRITAPADMPGGKAKLEQLASTVAGFNKPSHARPDNMDSYSNRGGDPVGRSQQASNMPQLKRNQFMDDGGSQMSNPNQRRHPTSKMSRVDANKKRMATTQLRQKDEDPADRDFAKIFGQDIDQYLEDSNFDLDEFDDASGHSQGGPASQPNMKLREMEQMYLERVKSSKVNNHQQSKNDKTQHQQSRSRTDATSHKNQTAKSHKKPPAFREFQDRFVDQPEFVHRGQILEFETKQEKRYQSNIRKRQN